MIKKQKGCNKNYKIQYKVIQYKNKNSNNKFYYWINKTKKIYKISKIY